MNQEEIKYFLSLKTKELASDHLSNLVASGKITKDKSKELMTAWNFTNNNQNEKKQ